MRADKFRRDFEELLEAAVKLANCNVSKKVLNSGEIVTDNTIEAEKRLSFYPALNLISV